MELRWIKGNWGFGKYKLQYLDQRIADGKTIGWVDVPEVDEKPNEHKHKWNQNLYNEKIFTCACGLKIFNEEKKPNGKSLEEKFNEFLCRYTGQKLSVCGARDLVEIVTAHFKGKHHEQD